MPIGIYPPILASTQSAFLATTRSYPIKFSLQDITDPTNIGHIQIRIALNDNQEQVVGKDTNDGIIYKLWPYDKTKPLPDICEIIVNSSDLIPELAWQPDTLYKIQLRFGETGLWPGYPGTTGFAKWKQDQIDKETFSEWSTVMVVKAISPLNPTILNSQDVSIEVKSQQTEPTTTPLFTGYCKQVDPTEYIDSYKFELFVEDNKKPIEESEWQQHIKDINDTWRFKNVLLTDTEYRVKYTVRTRNGYEISASEYTFSVVPVFLLEKLDGVKLFVDDEDSYCKNNGCIQLYLNITKEFTGTLVITRSCETNFNVYEEIKYLTYTQKLADNELVYTDFTIESGMKYKYAIQKENSAGLRTNSYQGLELDGSNRNTFCVDFEYSYLLHNDVQLRLMFNQNMSSFKHTTLTSKQDTLGSKYPYLTRNGNAYYAEFPITGLISFQMDPDRTFISCNNDGCFYQEELIITEDKFEEPNAERLPISTPVEGADYIDSPYEEIDDGMIVSSNLINNNIFIERKFREKVEEFLNNFDYKLYKSPTEGNIVVVLTNVTMQPNTTLGRMIYQFSATAYEVVENTISNLDKYGIIDIGEFQPSINKEEVALTFGQISGLYTNSAIDIYQLIKQQEEKKLGEEGKLYVEQVNSFWVDRYPQISFSNAIAELEVEQSIADKTGNEQLVKELQKQIDEYTKLEEKLQSSPNVTVQLTVNSNPVIVAPNRMYSVDAPITSLVLNRSSYPIIINYICELRQEVDEESLTEYARDSSKIWGQISGVFTGTEKILQQYRYNYHPNQSPLRITSNNPISIDSSGRVVLDHTNYNVYKTVNIFDVIEEEVRHQVEVLYGVTNGLIKVGDHWENQDGTLRYSFGRLTSFDIEAEPNTILEIGTSSDEKKEIRIGPSGRYVLKPLPSAPNITYIALTQGQYILVNYECETGQSRLKKGGKSNV